MSDIAIMLVVILVLVGLALFPLRHEAKKVRVWYLNDEKTNYIRLRPNPGVTIGDFHFCLARKRSCSFRKSGSVISQHNERSGN